MSDMDFKKRGLGRGLDALFGDEEVEFAIMDGGTETASETPSPGQKQQMLGIDQMRAGAYQPRGHFDDKELRELSDSIKAHGLLQPILVRPDTDIVGEYEIIAGERRWRAAQMAGLHDVPVIIKDMEDSSALEIGVIENLQRTDLNAIEEAAAFQRLISEFGYKHEEVGHRVGKSRSYITNQMRLLNLPPSVQTMLIDGDISAGHARAIVNADDPETMARWVKDRKLNVRELEQILAEQAGKKSPPVSASPSPAAPKLPKDSDILALEAQLSEALGMRVTLSQKSNAAGSLQIEYKSLDQLDAILGRLA